MKSSLTDKEKLENLCLQFQKCLEFLYDKHRDVYEEYISHLKPIDDFTEKWNLFMSIRK